MSPTIVVQAAGEPFAARRTEICEHKGIGHPDTIADGACEAAALALAREYRRAFGRVLHFNVDKALLAAGASEPCFGGGRILAPAQLILCGRASNSSGVLDIDEVVVSAAREHIRRNLPGGVGLFDISSRVRPGSPELSQLYPVAADTAPRANDTSFGAGHAPLSALEQGVLRLASVLRAPEFRARFPVAGDDYKIMGLRVDDVCSMTVAVAMIDRHVANARHYFEIKNDMLRALHEAVPLAHDLVLNALDDPHASAIGDLYLTVTGLSAEMGDDGQVGRGNRVNGLITPGRPMSLEAAAGKNPAGHVGKIYNVLAGEIARAVCAEIEEIAEASVELLATIGRPLGEPRLASVTVVPRTDLDARLQTRVTEIVQAKLQAVDELTARLERGEIAVY